MGGTVKKIILVIFAVFQILVTQVYAQGGYGYSNKSSVNEFTQEGELVSIRLVMGEPLRIFVVGKEEAKVNLSDLNIIVRRLKPYPGQTLTTSIQGDHFIVSKPEELKGTTDIAITTKIKSKSETLNFKINQKP